MRFFYYHFEELLSLTNLSGFGLLFVPQRCLQGGTLKGNDRFQQTFWPFKAMAKPPETGKKVVRGNKLDK